MSKLPVAKSAKSNASKSAPAKSIPAQAPQIDLSGIFMAGGGVRSRLLEADHPWQRRHRIGKALRERTPRESHVDGKAVRNRPDPLDLLAASNVGRQKDLIPLRMGRMAASPFTFLRGAACVMAWDLSRTPNSGIRVIIDGDATSITSAFTELHSATLSSISMTSTRRRLVRGNGT
jgi:hypothetical protein